MASGNVDIFLALRNARQFVADAREASKGVKGLGDATQEAGGKAKVGWQSVAKWAGGAVAVAGVSRFAKGAFESVQDLAGATLQLQRTTGLEAETASKWVGVTKERGIETGVFNRGLVTLSKQMQAAGKGSKGAVAGFEKLGVSMDAIRAGNTQEVLLQASEGLSKMQNPAERAALAQQLFARSGQQLLPVLLQGRAGVEGLLDEQRKSGKYLSGAGVNAMKDYAKNQRDLNRNVDGLKVQVGVALVPVMVNLSKVLLRVSNFLRPLTSNSKALTIVVGVLAGLFVAYKATMIGMAVAQNVVTIATGAWTAAQWLLNVALSANPIGLVVLAIVALVAIVVIAYKKIGWFRAGVDAAMRGVLNAVQWVWNWVKANWPLLLGMLAGPFGLAVVLIIRHWDAIQGAIKRVFDWLVSIAGRIAAPFVTAFENVKQALRAVLNFVIRGWNSLNFKIPEVKAPKWLGGAKFGGFSLGLPRIPELAQGGVVTSSGLFSVGERGPELVALPAGSAVSPAGMQIVVPLSVDGRELARAVARVTADQLARR